MRTAIDDGSSTKPRLPEIRIEALDEQGRGIGRLDGNLVVVEDALPGERVSYLPRGSRPRRARARLAGVLEPSPDRVEPRCRHFGVCGGCRLQHLDVAAQLRLKESRLREDLERIGSVAPEAMLPPVSGEPWGYRRRARLAVKHVPAKGGVLVGFRERSVSLVAVLDRCEVLHPRVGGLLLELRALFTEMEAKARIPQLEVAVGEPAVALVVRHLDPLSDSDRERLVDFARAHRVQVYGQPGGPDSVVALWPTPAPALSYTLPEQGIELRFGPTDFVQVNAVLNRRLVATALELLALGGRERVLDLFCGVGNFTLPVATRAGTVTGVEHAPHLVERARANARRNALTNARFEAADLADPDSARAWCSRGWDRLLLDPPRSGALAVVQSLAPPLPHRIVYVSCHSKTFARDAGVLVHDKGYRLVRAGVVDMFPHTNQAEAVALFTREVPGCESNC